jgi:hypothetical protein
MCAAVARIYSFLPQRSCRDDPLPCLPLRSSGLFLSQYKWRSRRRLLTPLPTWPAAGGGNRRGHGPNVRARGRRSSPGPRTSLCSFPPAPPSTSLSSAQAAEGVGVLLPGASSTSTPVAEGLGFCSPTGYPATRSAVACAVACAFGYSCTAYFVGGVW